MKVGVSGAGGHLGKAIVQELKSKLQASEIVAISRTPDQAAALGVEARFGDYDQPDSLAKAYAGLDRVVIIPTTDLRPGARQKQHVAAVKAAADAGAHVIFVSGTGVRGEKSTVWEAYFDAEQAAMRHAKKWTILRMAYYIESLADEAKQSLGFGVLASTSATPVNFVSRDDLAAAAAAVLTTDGHHGAQYLITGPESLDAGQRAAAVSKAVGKTIPYVPITREQFKAGLEGAGLPDFVVDTVVSLKDGWELGAFDVTSGDVERLTGRKPKSVAEVFAKLF